MKTHSGGTVVGATSFLVSRPCVRWLAAAALTLLMLGLPLDARPARAAPPSSGAHVYLLRGVLNVFSLGMDEIAAKLERQGIHTTVANYLLWSSLAEEAAAEYKSGRVRTIILVGHSSGATALPDMAARLAQLGVPVKLAIGLDSAFPTTAAGHVGRYINFYIADGVGKRVDNSRQFHGVLENVDVEKMAGIGHVTIDKNEIMQRKVIGAIDAAVWGDRRAPAPQTRQSPGERSVRQSSVTAGTAPAAGR